MDMSPSTIIRPALAITCVCTLCATVLLGISAPEWFLVITTTIISFYFGHINGSAEKSTLQAGTLAVEALKKTLNSPDYQEQPRGSTRTTTTGADASSVSVTTTDGGSNVRQAGEPTGHGNP